MNLDNLFAFSFQSLTVIAAGLAVPALLRLKDPRWHLPYLQCLLLLALLLPVVQPWRKIPALALPSTASTLPSTAPALALPSLPHKQSQSSAPIRWQELLLSAIAIGIAVRLAMLAAGLGRLRTYRRNLQSLPAFMGTPVGLSDQVSGPVTFGWLSPVILLPPQTLALPEAARESILLHEWIHVRRGDWPLAVVEELLLCLFWFHPAFWLLVEQIRLTREKLVDSEVRREASTEDYVNALLSMARLSLQSCTVPFLRRRQLFARIQTLLSEVTMSRSRLAVSYFAAAILSITAAVWAASASPLQQLVQEPDRISVRGAEIIVALPSTGQPIVQRPAGTVNLELTLDESGSVADARVLSGPQALRRAAIRRALDLRFKPGPTTANVDLDFDKSTSPTQVPAATQAAKLIAPIMPELPPLAAQANIQGTVRIDAVIGKDGTIRRMTLRSGHPLLVQSAIDAVRNARWATTLFNGEAVEVSTEIVVPFVVK